jgi:Xaa-Pro aminopeptidase
MTPTNAIDTDKTARLDALLDRRDLASVWFARPTTFAWLTGGDNVVDRSGDVGVAAAGYDGEAVRVITDDIEAERLGDEQLPDEITVESFEWHVGSLSEVVTERAPSPAGADFEVPGADRVEAGPLRYPLTSGDVTTYRDLGRETARAVERVCRDADPGDTEQSVAAALRGRLAQRGIDAPVALVGGSNRARKYRHYTPTEATLGEYALVSVTATRDGLFASCTRTVAFDPPDVLDRRHRAAARVEVTALSATRECGLEGGTAADVFGAIQVAYERTGHRGEWRNHHQGGSAGYAGREWIATPDLATPIALPHAYAWNPTVRGAKSEDTVLVTGEGFETLTDTGDWPTEPFEAVSYAETLDRPTVLVR